MSQFLITSVYPLSICLYTFYCICIHLLTINGLPWWLNSKESACSAGASGDESSIRESGRSPLRGYGNPPQYSCLENPMDRGAWQATVHRVAKSGTWLKQLSMHACIGNIYITTFFWFCFSGEPKFSLQSKRNSNVKSRNISENSVILTFFF